jgi:phage terminase large subunit-like protein
MPRKTTSGPVMTPVEMLQELMTGLKQQVNNPNIFAYKPHSKQLPFHQSTKKKKLYIGGNRSGKTTGSIVEDIYWLRGHHPYRKIPEAPIRGRVLSPSLIDGVQKIIIPQFQQWMPPSLLKNGSWEDSYSKELRTLTLTNGSFVEFMSYEMMTNKFAGTSRHFIHYDEEPPLHIFNECNARLVDTNGDYWISMTPVDGMTWVYDDLYLPASENKDDSIFMIEVDMLDNPHITKEAAENFLAGLDKTERSAREHGHFVELGGKVYKSFTPELHVIEPMIPDHSWEWYLSLDHGFNNPTAALWHAVSPDGDVITFDEHYASEMIIDDHARIIHERNSAQGRKIPEFWIADPALAQRQGVTGVSIFTEYADRGCYFAPGNNDVPSGIARINQYLKPNSNNVPKWHITANCENLIREIQRLRWKTYASKKMNYEHNKQEQVHKKDDHACDSARYFFNFLPDLAPIPPTKAVSEEGGFVLSGVNGVPPGGTIDNLMQRMYTTKPTEWKNVQGTDIGALEYD